MTADIEAPDPSEAELVDLGETVRPTGLRRAPWRVALAIAAAIAVVSAGFIFANRPDIAIVAASTAPSPSPSPVQPSPTKRPDGPSPSATPAPTCVPVAGDDPEDPIEAILRRGSETSATWVASDGFVEPEELAASTSVTNAIETLVDLGPEYVLWTSGTGRIDVATTQHRCMAEWSATFVKLDGPMILRTLTAKGTLDPARDHGTLVAPPVGDWLVRIVRRFPIVSGSRWIESFSRLVVGAEVEPAGRLVSPTVPCGSESGAADATLFLGGRSHAGSSTPAGAPAPHATEVLPVRFGSTTEIRIAGDRCAVTWEVIATRRPRAGEQGVQDTIALIRTSVAPDPAVAAQNRFTIDLGSESGTWDIVAAFQLIDGSTLSRSWVVEAEGLIVPSVSVGREGSAVRVSAFPGCGYYVELPNGTSYGSDCVAPGVPTTLETLTVRADWRLTYEAAGWQVAEWSASTGNIGLNPREFEETPQGFLRSASSPPVDFPVPSTRGLHAVQLSGSLVRDGVRLNGSWFFLVDVR